MLKIARLVYPLLHQSIEWKLFRCVHDETVGPRLLDGLQRTKPTLLILSQLKAKKEEEEELASTETDNCQYYLESAPSSRRDLFYKIRKHYVGIARACFASSDGKDVT